MSAKSDIAEFFETGFQTGQSRFIIAAQVITEDQRERMLITCGVNDFVQRIIKAKAIDMFAETAAAAVPDMKIDHKSSSLSAS